MLSTLLEALSFKKQNKTAHDKTTSEIGEMVCFKKKMIEIVDPFDLLSLEWFLSDLALAACLCSFFLCSFYSTTLSLFLLYANCKVVFSLNIYRILPL